MVKRVIEWVEWESITHTVVFLLFLYIMSRLLRDKTERTVQNLLLLLIALALGVLIHQNINFRNKIKPTYIS